MYSLLPHHLGALQVLIWDEEDDIKINSFLLPCLYFSIFFMCPGLVASESPSSWPAYLLDLSHSPRHVSGTNIPTPEDQDARSQLHTGVG